MNHYTTSALYSQFEPCDFHLFELLKEHQKKEENLIKLICHKSCTYVVEITDKNESGIRNQVER